MRKPHAGIAFIFITVFLDMLGLGIVFPILPELLASFLNNNLSVAAQYYGYFSAVYAAMQFLCAPVLGALSDQYGRRPVLLISLFGASLDYVLLSFAPSLAWLFIGRLIAGVTAASFTAANAYIADVSSPEQRAQNFGVIGAAFGLGFIIGPVLGGVIGVYGLRVPFMVAGGLTLLNFLYGLFVLPESLAPEHRRRFSWRNANPLASLGALARYPIVLALTAVVVCSSLGQQGLQTVWVLYTTYRFAWNIWQQGVSLAVVGVLSILVEGVLLRVLLPWLGDRRALVFALISSTIGMVLYGLATQGWMMYAVLIGTSLSFIVQPAAQGIISNTIGADEQGTIQGALTSLLSLTGVVGPVVATSLFSYYTAPERAFVVPGAPFFLGAILTLLALVLAFWTFRRTPVAVTAVVQDEPA